MVQGNKFGF